MSPAGSTQCADSDLTVWVSAWLWFLRYNVAVGGASDSTASLVLQWERLLGGAKHIPKRHERDLGTIRAGLESVLTD